MAKAQQTPEDQEAPATSAQVVALAGRVIEQLRVVNARLDNSRARSRNKPIVLANAPLPLNPLGKEWQPTAGGAAVGTLPPQPDDEGAIGPVSSHSPTKRLCHPGTYAAPQPLQQLHSLPPHLSSGCLPAPTCIAADPWRPQPAAGLLRRAVWGGANGEQCCCLPPRAVCACASAWLQLRL